ncbi:MAG: restriction endonuclease subunit R [Deltaproteobacteria bacterium]|jgi:predicted type IV restriction endonuclease|nr:restriction endonuclease subunit R [Deltaproteobacteria bacterium]
MRPLEKIRKWRSTKVEDGMKKDIVAFIQNLKTNKKLETFDEASTKQAVVLRLLSFLGWDIFNVDEVYPDYTVNSYSASYALRNRNANKILIEVKRVHEKLDNYQKALLSFAAQEKVDISVLTNGVSWWFYLTHSAGNSQDKWFYSADLFKQNEDAVVPNLIDLLSKDKVANGQALKAAQALNQNKNQKMAADVIPEAWNKLVSQPNMILVELLRESTEKICGCKVESKPVERFLEKNLDRWLITNRPVANLGPPPKVIEIPAPEKKSVTKIPSLSHKKSILKPESYVDKEIKSFTFNGKTNPVRYWEDLLTNLCDYFAAIHSKDFEKVLWISGEDKTYFSRYSDQLRIPEKIKGMDIYVETKLSPDEIVKTSRSLLTEFGYDTSDLTITTR